MDKIYPFIASLPLPMCASQRQNKVDLSSLIYKAIANQYGQDPSNFSADFLELNQSSQAIDMLNDIENTFTALARYWTNLQAISLRFDFSNVTFKW
ncbi:hypothetical protein GJ496_011372 [Pomphorhynchus laevis]|nr:hypothetical protein GJ496_011372 [Pomphorhynchus laevis]